MQFIYDGNNAKTGLSFKCESTGKIGSQKDELEDDKSNVVSILKEESKKSLMWNKLFLHPTMFLLGDGAYGSVFQVITRMFLVCKQKGEKETEEYSPNFVDFQRRLRKQRSVELNSDLDKDRSRELFDLVAVKYEIIKQSMLDNATTRHCLFLRRELLVMEAMFHRVGRLLIGFPVPMAFGHLGNKIQYGISCKYNDTFTYFNKFGIEENFNSDPANSDLKNVTRISFLAMELVGPTVDDLRKYFSPWFVKYNQRAFFSAPTVFKLADQVLCRLLVMHRCGFVHHDLKPDNLALGKGRALNTVYLLDFGFAKEVSKTKMVEWMGTRKYIAIDTYNLEPPNFAQDIESWFYVVMSLLLDALPWSEGLLSTTHGRELNENEKWTSMIKMKETWWDEKNKSPTLQELIKDIAKAHSATVPGIQGIIEDLHKEVLSLRLALRQTKDSRMLKTSLSNLQSPIFRGYMSVRKILLQIFSLPNIKQNPQLGDADFNKLQRARQKNGFRLLPWDKTDFRWDWDVDHAQMMSEYLETKQQERIPSIISTTEQPKSQSNIQNVAAAMLTGLPVKKRSTADEVSYIYNSETGDFVTKRGHPMLRYSTC